MQRCRFAPAGCGSITARCWKTRLQACRAVCPPGWRAHAGSPCCCWPGRTGFRCPPLWTLPLPAASPPHCGNRSRRNSPEAFAMRFSRPGKRRRMRWRHRCCGARGCGHGARRRGWATWRCIHSGAYRWRSPCCTRCIWSWACWARALRWTSWSPRFSGSGSCPGWTACCAACSPNRWQDGCSAPAAMPWGAAPACCSGTMVSSPWASPMRSRSCCRSWASSSSRSPFLRIPAICRASPWC